MKRIEVLQNRSLRKPVFRVPYVQCVENIFYDDARLEQLNQVRGRNDLCPAVPILQNQHHWDQI